VGLDESLLETLLGQVRRTDSLIMAGLNERQDGFERRLTYQAGDASRSIARRGDRSSPRAFPTFGARTTGCGSTTRRRRCDDERPF